MSDAAPREWRFCFYLDEVRKAHPDIPWRMVIATRNRLIHGYLGIDNDTLWSLVRDNVPELLTQLKELRAT
jgi:uncharacterized protein with HEPN domain